MSYYYILHHLQPLIVEKGKKKKTKVALVMQVRTNRTKHEFCPCLVCVNSGTKEGNVKKWYG